MSNILELSNVRKEFHTSSSKRAIVAVDNISLKLEKGKTLGIVGESGSGKSTLGRLMLRLIEPSAGEIKFDDVNLLNLKNTELRKMRSKMQMIFQDPMSSLNPRMSIRQLISEPLEIHKNLKASEQNFAVEEIIKSQPELVGGAQGYGNALFANPTLEYFNQVKLELENGWKN